MNFENVSTVYCLAMFSAFCWLTFGTIANGTCEKSYYDGHKVLQSTGLCPVIVKYTIAK